MTDISFRSCECSTAGVGHWGTDSWRENAGQLYIWLSCELRSVTFLTVQFSFLHCQVVMLVYDITNYSSFENLDDWLAIIQRECFKSDITPPHLALVANKSGQHY